MTERAVRFIGMDIHRHFIMVGAVDAQQQVVLPPRRVDLEQFVVWVARHLHSTDQVVMEATTNVWDLYDIVAPLVAKVKVAHPYHVKLIACAMVKTDRRDTLSLARLLAAHWVPEVWVPPQPVRELRSLIVHRSHLVKQRRATKNRLRGVLFRHNLVPPPGDLFASTHRAWWDAAPLNAVERLRVRHDLAMLDFTTQQIDEVDAELARLSVRDPWQADVPFLVQMSGVGLISAMIILSAIGDITRFPEPKRLVGYAGLGARVHASGQTFQGGKITKQGRCELRTTLIEVAWTTVQNSPVWRARYQRLARQLGSQKAIVAIARKLLVAIWHILTHRQVDRNTDPVAIERAFLDWGSRHRLASSLGLSRPEFVRQALHQIGLPVPERSAG